jgi:hypothetical protein
MHPSRLFLAGIVSTLIACAGPLVLRLSGSAGLDIAIGSGAAGMC